MAAELSGRRWAGSELECSSILDRFENSHGDVDHMGEIRAQKNRLFTEVDLKRREKSGRPISPNYRLANSVLADESSCDCPAQLNEQGILNLS